MYLTFMSTLLHVTEYVDRNRNLRSSYFDPEGRKIDLKSAS